MSEGANEKECQRNELVRGQIVGGYTAQTTVSQRRQLEYDVLAVSVASVSVSQWPWSHNWQRTNNDSPCQPCRQCLFLPTQTVAKYPTSPAVRCPRALLTAFISSLLDYCNAKMYGVTSDNIHRLQVVMNTATWLQIRAHYTNSSQSIHWLPVQQRIIFKITVLAFNCIRDTGPDYFNDVCTPIADIPGRSSLRAANLGHRVPLTETKIASRSFRFQHQPYEIHYHFICRIKLSANVKVNKQWKI